MHSIVLTFFLLFMSISASPLRRSTAEYPNLEFGYHQLNRKDTNDNDQCTPVEFTNSQLGLINVVAFLDYRWPFSYKQAEMLKGLKDRLERNGITEMLFFIIINNSTEIDASIDRIEEMAWINVAPDEVRDIKKKFGNYASLNDDNDNSTGTNKYFTESFIDYIKLFKDTIPPDITVIEDSETNGIWRDLNGSRDEVLVIDRCGKVTYQIITPWSILHFPYVKAAILSTYNDDPCGPCESYATVINFDPLYSSATGQDPEELSSAFDNDLIRYDNMTYEDSGDMSSTSDMSSTTLSNNKTTNGNGDEIDQVITNELPGLKVIMHAPHYHINDDSTKKHEYLVVEFNKPDYHGHLDSPDANKYVDGGRQKSGIILDSIIFDKDESPGFYGEVADFWHDPSSEDNGDDVNDANADELNSSFTPMTNQFADLNDGELNPEHSSGYLMNDELETQTEESNDNGDDDNDDSDDVHDEETRSKMIAHYSKLLRWLYYNLN